MPLQLVFRFGNVLMTDLSLLIMFILFSNEVKTIIHSDTHQFACQIFRVAFIRYQYDLLPVIYQRTCPSGK